MTTGLDRHLSKHEALLAEMQRRKRWTLVEAAMFFGVTTTTINTWVGKCQGGIKKDFPGPGRPCGLRYSGKHHALLAQMQRQGEWTLVGAAVFFGVTTATINTWIEKCQGRVEKDFSPGSGKPCGLRYVG